MNQTDVTAIQSAITKALPTDDVQFVTDDADTLQKQVKDEELDGAVMINAADFSRYTYYVKDQSMYDANTEAFDGIFTTALQQKALEEENVSAAKAGAILSLSASHDIVNLGADMSTSFIYAYIMVMALYTVIAMYGQMVASRVAGRKRFPRNGITDLQCFADFTDVWQSHLSMSCRYLPDSPSSSALPFSLQR
ncbi:MAG: hypothetical protein LKE83_02035 [Erysipelotrichaceae bacterium]|jgi:hypothetical protein|nr:hypothetical protein [Erysipelotrichaceae bacterium]